MIELIFLFAVMCAVFYSQFSGPKEVRCKGGHSWSINYNTEKMECTTCGLRL